MVPAEIAACHPLAKGKLAPVTLKFAYHHHRDVVWRRKSWLKGVLNSKQKRIVIEECLAPSDRNLKAAAKSKKIPHFTQRQRVFATNVNVPNSEPVEVKNIKELQDFGKIEVKASDQRYGCQYMTSLPGPIIANPKIIETPQRLPPLTRKPPTKLLNSGRKNPKRTLSPVQEQMKSSIAEALVPVISSSIQPSKVSKLSNAALDENAEGDIEYADDYDGEGSVCDDQLD